MGDVLGGFEQAVLLSVLELADGAYGRAVLRGVESALRRGVSAGAVYATLDRLEQKALLDSRLEKGAPERDGRARRFYRLTPEGVAALNDSKAALERMWQAAQWPLNWPA